MLKFLTSALLVGSVLVLATPAAHADDVYTFVVKKQEQKQSNHWSLAEWLETRDKMRLMDLWLALHTPTPYEFFVRGAYVSDKSSPGETTSGFTGSFAAFATIFGLEGIYSSEPHDTWHALFDLRIFGYHDQGTNITLQGGVRSQSSGGKSFRNGTIGARSNIYLAKKFGIEGLYRHYFNSTPAPGGVVNSANRFEAGAFIDFNFVRISADYFGETDTNEAPGGSSNVKQSGYVFAGTIYF